MKKIPIVVNIRGNSGSGKTHLTRQFMKHAQVCLPVKQDTKVLGYQCAFKGSKTKWYVLGSYENTCGGCDTIKTQQEIIDRVQEAVNEGFNVWLEGLLISGMYGSVGKYSELFGDHWIFAYLLTPLELCLERVQQRRDEAGNTKPFNQENTIMRHKTIFNTKMRIIQMQRNVVELPQRNPLPAVLKIIEKEGAL